MTGVDRRRALGNAVCPQVAELIGRLIMPPESGWVDEHRNGAA